MAVTVQATPVLPGAARGRVLRLGEPLSFWGGIDPRTGFITDPACGATGRCVAGTVLVLPSTRGSSSGSAVLLQLLYAGLAPAAIVLGDIDAILGLGVLVAGEMGWPTIPLLLLAADAQSDLVDGTEVAVDTSGVIRAGTSEAPSG